MDWNVPERHLGDDVSTPTKVLVETAARMFEIPQGLRCVAPPSPSSPSLYYFPKKADKMH